jgi:hypothetical protein
MSFRRRRCATLSSVRGSCVSCRRRGAPSARCCASASPVSLSAPCACQSQPAGTGRETSALTAQPQAEAARRAPSAPVLWRVAAAVATRSRLLLTSTAEPSHERSSRGTSRAEKIVGAPLPPNATGRFTAKLGGGRQERARPLSTTDGGRADAHAAPSPGCSQSGRRAGLHHSPLAPCLAPWPLITPLAGSVAGTATPAVRKSTIRRTRRG